MTGVVRVKFKDNKGVWHEVGELLTLPEDEYNQYYAQGWIGPTDGGTVVAAAWPGATGPSNPTDADA